MLDQNAFSESPELMKHLDQLGKTEEGYYKVSSLAELAGVLRQLRAEKLRQNRQPEKTEEK